ncbi:COX15/CtaA family protein [Alterisphingorhabdus coralli]|uniref:Heme A synthase n=1 Tax=Alterisphingorhabdus coralli TaxID=3071408 RepID=A0AA97I3D8_9SPHN|nr:COX15/CtaA family protein [Parasphingorhabdus sp. SCSIO 66989]WOE76700.1 COX15/CtaA family protein [Parasphingorhabdus sp. SCSIO 66989]
MTSASTSIASVPDIAKNAARPAAIANWLWAVALLVFAMVVVGGITRLTESGLSITEWKPVTGALPPLSDAAWAEEFSKYQQIPEYIEINGPAGMTLADFKFIYFWEWVHRLLGRLVGVAFVLPLLWFWVKNAIPQGYKGRLLALLALGALQGTIGWWMVESGLSERTDVSHFRLAVHLLNALFILGGLAWTALDLHRHAKGLTRPARMTGLGLGVIAILFVQLLFGAWVAGLNAGLVSDTWPLMEGSLVPALNWDIGLGQLLVNDPTMIHFIHRWWAWIAVAALTLLGRKVRPLDRRVSIALFSTFGIQVLLGIATVLTQVNITMAVLHQAVGALLVLATVWAVHRIGWPADQSLMAGDSRARESQVEKI